VSEILERVLAIDIEGEGANTRRLVKDMEGRLAEVNDVRPTILGAPARDAPHRCVFVDFFPREIGDLVASLSSRREERDDRRKGEANLRGCAEDRCELGIVQNASASTR
jgi:hypothetical protein